MSAVSARAAVPVGFFKRRVVVAGGAATLLLDEADAGSARAAYSVRLLRAAYAGQCLRVRRSSDNAEQDISFVDGYLDTSSLLTFVGANDGFVVTWYDQSGNANDLAQATAGNQPKLVAAGALITAAGSKAAILGDGSNDALTKTMSYAGPQFVAIVMNQVTWTSQDFCWALNNGGNQILVQRDASPGLAMYDSGYSTVSNSAAVGTPFIFQTQMYSSGSFFQINNNSDVTFGNTNPTINSVNLFAYTSGGASAANVHFQEFVFWGVAHSSGVRTTIRNNQNAYFTVY